MVPEKYKRKNTNAFFYGPGEMKMEKHSGSPYFILQSFILH
jgi:hypothetical protein